MPPFKPFYINNCQIVSTGSLNETGLTMIDIEFNKELVRIMKYRVFGLEQKSF